MGVILHQNSRGVKMIREDFKKRSQVKVVSEYKGKRYCLRTYRFDFIQETFDSPFYFLGKFGLLRRMEL